MAAAEVEKENQGGAGRYRQGQQGSDHSIILQWAVRQSSGRRLTTIGRALRFPVTSADEQPRNQTADQALLARQAEDFLEQNRLEELKVLLRPLHPTDIADVIERLPDSLRPTLFDLLDDVDRAADVMLELDTDAIQTILHDLDRAEIAELVREMSSDDAADVVGRLDDRERSEVISDLPEEDRGEVAELLKYPESSAGGRMRMEFVALLDTDTVATATEKVRAAEREEEEPPVLYVVDPTGRLIGYFPLRDLLRNPPELPIREAMQPVSAFARVLDDQEQVAGLARKYDITTVPVVDDSDRLVGIVTADDILDVVVEEASEDIAKLGQTSDIEDVFAPVRRSIRGRVPWLFVSLLGGVLASIVVLLFQGTIKSAVIVAAFMPIVAGVGGAAGNQATNIIVRALALGEVTSRDIGRLLWKQVRVGLVAGIATGLVTSAVALLMHGSPLLGGVVFLAMVLNVTVGSTLGAMTPMLLARMRKDPALASSLLLTATTDTVGLLILLGLATLAFHFFNG